MAILSEAEITAIEARRQAATAGPYRSAWDDPEDDKDDADWKPIYAPESGVAVVEIFQYDGLWVGCNKENSAFLAASWQDVRDLVDTVRHLQNVLQGVKNQLQMIDLLSLPAKPDEPPAQVGSAE